MNRRQELKHQTFMDIAELIGKLGTCDRKQVGALIVKDGRCVSWGFNGAPPHAPHCDENNHGWMDKESVEIMGCCNAIHAEANALAFAARHGISTEGATMYVTLSPCLPCAQLAYAAGIVDVHYREAYRYSEGADFLQRMGLA
jgi:dCMP deaminase